MGKRTPGPLGRQQAKALNAADARTILRAELPLVLKHMSEKQLDHMQRVLDAAVVNPAVEKEANDIYRRSVRAQSGSLVMRDERMVRRAYRVLEGRIHVTEADKRIRLDFEALLANDALKPRTDNPDEAAYLELVRKALANRGVWLRFGKKYVRDPEDPSAHILDPRQFNVWLSLDPDGDEIPTDTGLLTREFLLKTTTLGAGYYDHVHRGPTQRAIDREVQRLRIEIETGIDQHNMLAKIRRDAFPGVTEVSDLLGGADFPDRSIWDQPHRFVIRAMELNVGGNVKAAQAFLVAAAVITRNAARLLAQYIDDTSSGAERAVKVLKVAKTAGEVAEIGLTITGVGAVVRGAVRTGAGAVARSEVDDAAEKLVREYVAKNPEIAGDLARVRWVPGPKGSVAGGVKPGTSAGHGQGFERWP